MILKGRNFADWTCFQLRPGLMDATRMSDGRLVYLKRVKAQESNIINYFSSDDLQRDPDNHCVPILDVIQDDKDSRSSYIVMPFLRLMDDPPFAFVNDVVDLADQLLEVCCPSIITGFSTKRITRASSIYTSMVSHIGTRVIAHVQRF